LVPLLHALHAAFGRAGAKPSFAEAAIELLARVLEKRYDADGAEVCRAEIDPNRTLATVLGRLLTPLSPDAPAPIELLLDTVADVNRAHPELAGAKLDAADYASIAFEVKDFCVNPSRGLTQVYEVIREATLP
jgi:hypothetical protein